MRHLIQWPSNFLKLAYHLSIHPFYSVAEDDTAKILIERLCEKPEYCHNPMKYSHEEGKKVNLSEECIKEKGDFHCRFCNDEDNCNVGVEKPDSEPIQKVENTKPAPIPTGVEPPPPPLETKTTEDAGRKLTNDGLTGRKLAKNHGLTLTLLGIGMRKSV